MTDFLRLISTLREHMQAELTRTDALRPLIWPIAGLLIAITGALTAHAPEWLLVVLVSAVGIALVVYVGAFIYFAAKDPDALRSEKYKLHKLAIEHGLYGDSSIGLIDAKQTSPSDDTMKTVSESKHD